MLRQNFERVADRGAGHRAAWAVACWSALLALAVSLCGCTSFSDYFRNGFKVGPNYRPAPAPVAQKWIDNDDVRLRKDPDDLCRWWTVFKDPTLDALVCSAYHQNLTLRQAGFSVLRARAQQAVATGGIFPQTQQLTADHTRNAASEVVANRSFLGEQFYSQTDLGFNLAWELDFWGRYRRSIEGSTADLDASVANYDDALVTLLGDVATNYVRIRTLQEQIVLTEANVVLLRDTLNLAIARFRGGTATELDVDQAQTTLSDTEALVPQLQTQLRQANDQLCILLGIPPEDLGPKLGPAPIPLAPPDVVVGMPADLLRRRPDIRRAERQAAAESARIGVAQSAFYPHISLTGVFGYSAELTNNLLSPAAFNGTFGPTLQWDVLNYGRILNAVRAQDAVFQAAVVNYQNTVLTAGAEVENGLVFFLRSQSRMKFLTVSVDAAQKAVNIALAQYRNGSIDFNRVAVIEQNLVTEQNSLALVRGDVAQGLIQTYRALGGGWQLRTTGCDPTNLPAAPPAAGMPGRGPGVQAVPPNGPPRPYPPAQGPMLPMPPLQGPPRGPE